MDISLTHLKKVLKFGIILGCISFVDLKSGLGTYTPSSLKGKKITRVVITSFGNLSLWEQTTMVKNYDSEALVRQSIVPSVMVDSTGAAYIVTRSSFYKEGIVISLLKYNQQGQLVKSQPFSPWHRVNSSINCQTTPNLNVLTDVDDSTYFKNYIHNAFQPCIAQEVGKYSNYLYVFCCIPPTRYMGISSDKDDEGILMLKIKKSDLSVVSQTFYPGGQNRDNYFSFNHQRPRRDNDNYAFGAEFGNYQAWVDTDDSGTDHVHLNWIALEAMDNFSSCEFYNLYNDNVSKSSGNYTPGGTVLNPKAIKHKEYTYVHHGYCGGRCNIVKCSPKHSTFDSQLIWFDRDYNPSASPFSFILHGSVDNPNTALNQDFCIIDNEGSNPIFCILGLRATSETGTGNYVTSLSGEINAHWKQNYFNEASKIVLILSSYAWDGNSSLSGKLVTKDDVIEDPQNIIYSTGKTPSESCSTTCGCYSNTYADYGDKQLFKNTHKLCTYTSESGTKYIIYCYCYPGKSKQLFLGYAPYIISNNKVQLLTKTEFKTPPSTDYPMGESFGDFTSCSRIISMDCKNGQLWITWMDKDNILYYRFHIAAKDLVGE